MVAYEDGMDDLKNAPAGSAMEEVYKNHMLGPGYDDKYEAIRDHTHVTSAKLWNFWTPFPYHRENHATSVPFCLLLE